MLCDAIFSFPELRQFTGKGMRVTCLKLMDEDNGFTHFEPTNMHRNWHTRPQRKNQSLLLYK